VRLLLPVVAFLVVTGAVATALLQLNVYANDRHDAALALVQVEAGVLQEDALAVDVHSAAGTFSAGAELTLQADSVRVAVAALASRHVDAADVARIHAAYDSYEAQRAKANALFSSEAGSRAVIDEERLVGPQRRALNS
jgi:hypothetical protein